MRIPVLIVLGLLSAACDRRSASAPVPVPAPVTVAPGGALVRKELFVTRSEPFAPGAPITLTDVRTNAVLVARVVPTYVRWKASGPFAAPAYPASGFVTMALTPSQWSVLEGVEGVAAKPVSTPAP